MASYNYGSPIRNPPNCGYVTSTPSMNNFAPQGIQSMQGMRGGYQQQYAQYGAPNYGANGLSRGYSAPQISYGYNNPMCTFGEGYVTNQYNPASTYLPMGYSQIPIPPQSKMEYVPYQSYFIDYIEQEYCQSVLVPCHKKGTDYYAVEHVTDYVPRQYEETVVEMVPEERIREKLTYLPVQTQIVHYPDENKPLYQPNLQNRKADQPREGMMHRENVNTRTISKQINQGQVREISSVGRRQQIPVNHLETQKTAPQNYMQPSSRPPMPPKIETTQTIQLPPQTNAYQQGVTQISAEHKKVEGEQLHKINSKYPPPHSVSQDGLIAGGQMKSHHRVVTSKPLNQVTRERSDSEERRKSLDTANLLNLANQSVRMQSTTQQPIRNTGSVMQSGTQNIQTNINPQLSSLQSVELKHQQSSGFSSNNVGGSNLPNLPYMKKISSTSNQAIVSNTIGTGSGQNTGNRLPPSIPA